eukprot:TRINITY_DN1774_c0_g2_i1.p1 TRINITY_DN1774_c0_g2~~TRINITY_DN1774_c0_g2_i1.p1  ORF type:complete len:498 (+),score=227.84 TRINITY_DN1774_c0_g2_i1:129-1622(+)
MGKQTFILFETAAGYALFEKNMAEEIGANDVEIQMAWQEFARFKSAVAFRSFAPFRNSEHALENINALSEGQVTQFLASFLQEKLPRPKKVDYELGVAETKMGSAIQENLGIPCVANEHIYELQRGIRVHIEKLVPALKPGDTTKACLGLGHAYSRSKVKFNVNRADNMIIQAIAIIAKLNKDINTFAMRVKEWYGWHFPELHKIVSDNHKYCKLALFIKHKEKLTDDALPRLTEICDDEALAERVLAGAKISMGGEISEVDMVNIESFATRLDHLVDLHSRCKEYLTHKIDGVSPNLGALMGDFIAGRLISHAGSLMNLAKYPASTIQILGAEKALFRALKSRGNTPKYGLIYDTSFIGRAKGKNKGRISRYLANKAAIACRIDCFGEERTKVFGEKLKEQVDDRLLYYEEQKQPRKNTVVMEEALKAFRKELRKAAKRKAAEEETPAPAAKKARSSPAAAAAPSPKMSPAASAAAAEGMKKKKKKKKRADAAGEE